MSEQDPTVVGELKREIAELRQDVIEWRSKARHRKRCLEEAEKLVGGLRSRIEFLGGPRERVPDAPERTT